MKQAIQGLFLTLVLLLNFENPRAQHYYLQKSSLDTSAPTYSYNGSAKRKRNRTLRKFRNKYGLESYEEYDFKACQQYQKDDANEKYYISCHEGQLVQDENFEKLIGATKAIEAKTYKDNLLHELKDHTVSELERNISNLSLIKKCSSDSKADAQCPKLLSKMLEVMKTQLPQMRATMAMMKEPIKMRGYTGPPYRTRIEHEVPTGDIPNLTKNEIEKVKETADAIKYQFQQDWFAKNAASNRCIENLSPTSYQFKKSANISGYSCQGYNQQKLDNDVKRQFKDFRKKLEKNYFTLISQNPILAHLNLTGEESQKDKLTEVNRVVTKLLDQSKQSLDGIKDLDGDELSSLIRKDSIVESYLQKQGPSEVLCDVSQSLKDEEDFEELKTDIFLAGGALIGGGICAFTAGIGCVIGVGVATEAVGIAVAQDRYEDAELSFNSGLSSAENYDDRKFERDFTLLLAPLSAAGDLIGKGAKIGAKAYKYSPDGSSFDTDFIGIRQRDKFRSQTDFRSQRVPKNKTAFINKYEGLILASPKLNGRWIETAKSQNAGLYLDIENAALKRLNDTIGDKSYVTALTNLHKDLVSSRINEMLKKYPGVDIEVYSDFKSVRYAFMPKDMSQEMKDALMKDLNAVYKEANTEYANMVKSLDGIPAKEDPDQWFQGGLGLSADQAGQTAKKARSLSRPAQLTRFDDIKSLIAEDVKTIQSFTSSLDSAHPLSKANLVETIPGTSKQTVSLPVFEVIRKVKAPTNEELAVFKSEYLKETGEALNNRQAAQALSSRRLANELETKFGAKLTPEQAQELFTYSNKLDSLTPGLWVKERVSANLNEANFGGMSGDVTGMGARNIRQVAYDLATQSDGDPAKVIAATRRGEQNVTQVFDDIKNNFKTTVKEVLDERGIGFKDPCSGDDCVMIPEKQLSTADENALVEAFAKQGNPSQYRLSFIPKGVKGADRTNLAVHGELVEKELRKRLIGVSSSKIDQQKLSQLTMATRMPVQINEGNVQLVLGIGKETKLSAKERKLIEDALPAAIQKVNQDLAQEAPDKVFQYGTGGIDWIE